MIEIEKIMYMRVKYGHELCENAMLDFGVLIFKMDYLSKDSDAKEKAEEIKRILREKYSEELADFCVEMFDSVSE